MMEDFLKKIPIFSTLKLEEISRLVDIIHEEKFLENTVILHKGQIGDKLYVIRIGQVKVVLTDKEGHEIILSVLKENDFFGEMSLFDNGESLRSATVIATTDTHVLTIKRNDFNELSEKYPQVALIILKNIINRLRITNEKIAGLSLMDIYGQLTRYRETMDNLKEMYETKLNAMSTVFQQTQQSAETVIKDSQRSRTRTTFVVTTIVSIFTILGALGSFIGMNMLEKINVSSQKAENILKNVEHNAEVVKDQRKKIETNANTFKKELKNIQKISQGLGDIRYELNLFQKSIYSKRLKELDDAVYEAWTDRTLGVKAYGKILDEALHKYEERITHFTNFSFQPFLEIIFLHFIEVKEEKSKKYKKIAEESELAVKHVTSTNSYPSNLEDQALSYYLLTMAYILDESADHENQIQETQEKLEEILESDKTIDLEGWELDAEEYPLNKRDKILKIQDLITNQET